MRGFKLCLGNHQAQDLASVTHQPRFAVKEGENASARGCIAQTKASENASAKGCLDQTKASEKRNTSAVSEARITQTRASEERISRGENHSKEQSNFAS